jgi:AcrR family transcriptional regulator
MARRKQRRMRGPERRAQLLGVARRVFGRSGYHDTSMDAVAKEAGVTKPILYDHFDSKEALYFALLDQDSSALEERVRSALTARTSNRERIRRSFRAYIEFVDEHAEGFRLVMRETLRPTVTARTQIAEVRARIVDEVTRLVVRESGGRIDPDDAGTVALALIGMVESVAQQEPGGSSSERKRTVDTLVDLAWRGLAAFSSRGDQPVA